MTSRSDCDVSDLRVFEGGTRVNRWQHSISADLLASGLDGFPIPDSTGDAHGTMTNGNGETGEGMDADVARIEGLDDAQWFNGVDTRVSSVGLGTFFADNAIQRYEFTINNAPKTTDPAFEFLWSIGSTSTSALHCTRQAIGNFLVIELIEGARNTKVLVQKEQAGDYVLDVNRTTGEMSLLRPDGSTLSEITTGETYGKNANGELHLGS